MRLDDLGRDQDPGDEINAIALKPSCHDPRSPRLRNSASSDSASAGAAVESEKAA
jgi:hypothetical protein